MPKPDTRTKKFADEPNSEDRRVRRTKRLLKEALIELIAESGYDEVSVQEILDRADVGRTSFYTYFRSKEDLLLRSLDDMGGLLDTDSGEDAVDNTILMYFRHLEEMRPIAKALLGNRNIPVIREHVERQFFEHYRKRLRTESGSSKTDLEIEAEAVITAGALISLTLWWLSMKKPVPAEQVSELFNNGTVPPEKRD